MLLNKDIDYKIASLASNRGQQHLKVVEATQIIGSEKWHE